MTSVTVISSTGNHFAMPSQIYWDKIIPVVIRDYALGNSRFFTKSIKIRQRKERKNKKKNQVIFSCFFLKTDP